MCIKRVLTVIGVAWPFLATAQSLPTLKATVGRPVIQELMGGCSMRCAFPWTTTALVPGKPPQPVYTLDDSSVSTAWLDPNPVVGTKLEFRFPAKLPAELNGTPFYGFNFSSGTIMPLETFKDYARVKKARISFDGKPLYDVKFADTYRWQDVFFDDIPAKQGDTMTFEILEIYPGKKHAGVAITEFILQGAH
jgi:hypothetical protein